MPRELLEEAYAAILAGDSSRARSRCLEILEARPELAEAHHALGLACCGAAAYEEALPHLRRAHELQPQVPRWARDLAAICARTGRWSDACELFGQVLAHIEPEDLTVYLWAAERTGRSVEAVARLEATTRALPDDPCFLVTYGRVLLAAGRLADAERAFTRSLTEEPDSLSAVEGLADVYEKMARGDRALTLWRERCRLDPRSPYAHMRLALATSDRGRCQEARAWRETAEALGLQRLEEHDTGLYIRLSDPLEDARSILAASRAAFAAVPSPADRDTTSRRPGTSRRLRVGYLSGEFRSTPAYYFFKPFLSHHDRQTTEVFLYNASPLRDDFTRAYMDLGEHWREVAHLRDADVRDCMRADDLDIAVDLSGHFPYNRLAVLQQPVAPVHATYPNYPGTTGTPGIDWLFTDRWTSPAGTETDYSEQLYRLDAGYLVFDPPDDCPPVTPPPLVATGRPVFGIFQRLAKLNDTVWDAVAGVLHACPDAQLLIQNAEPELDRPESGTARYVRQCLTSRDVDPARVVLRGPLPRAEHLALVGQVDVSLDTFPYAGQTTTCESLLMGVPVVTLMRDTHVSRVGAALLARIGRAEWVTTSPAEYVRVAASLASDRPGLVTIRRALRGDFFDAGLADGPRLARALEHAYATVVTTAGSPVGA